MTKRQRIIDRLERGPATGAELADMLETHTGDVARTMAALRRDGTVLSTATGRGSKAVYFLPVKP